LILEKPRKK